MHVLVLVLFDWFCKHTLCFVVLSRLYFCLLACSLEVVLANASQKGSVIIIMRWRTNLFLARVEEIKTRVHECGSLTNIKQTFWCLFSSLRSQDRAKWLPVITAYIHSDRGVFSVGFVTL